VNEIFAADSDTTSAAQADVFSGNGVISTEDEINLLERTGAGDFSIEILRRPPVNRSPPRSTFLPNGQYRFRISARSNHEDLYALFL